MSKARNIVNLMNEATQRPLKDIVADLEIPVVEAIAAARDESNEKVIQDLRDIQAKIHDIYNELGLEVSSPAIEVPPAPSEEPVV